MDIFPKFIVEDGSIILGKVTYHHQLMQSDDKKAVKGGGWFEFENKTNTFIFSGDSHDFGEANIEDMKNVIANNKVYSDTGIILEKPLDNQKYKFIYRCRFEGDIALS